MNEIFRCSFAIRAPSYDIDLIFARTKIRTTSEFNFFARSKFASLIIAQLKLELMTVYYSSR